MNRSWLGLVVLLTACDRGESSTPMEDAFQWHDQDAALPDAPAVPPLSTACVEHFTVRGNDPQTTRNPTLDTTGTAYCVTLDATMLYQPDFYVTTLQIQGERSPYELSLFDEQGTLLQPGWDVTYGSSPPHTFAHVEYSPAAHAATEAIVRVRMRDGVGTTQVALSLFDPFD